MLGKGHKKKVPECHTKLLDAWSKRGTIEYYQQFHENSEDYMNGILHHVDNFEDDFCVENKGEGIHLTGTKSVHKSGTSTSLQLFSCVEKIH